MRKDEWYTLAANVLLDLWCIVFVCTENIVVLLVSCAIAVGGFLLLSAQAKKEKKTEEPHTKVFTYLNYGTTGLLVLAVAVKLAGEWLQ